MAKVSVEGEVKATPSNGVASGADSGKWTADVSYTSYSDLKAGGKKVIWKASCLLSFSGKAGNSAFTTSETVTLEAKPKKLNKTSHAVIVAGDTITSTPEGNTLSASAANKLASA